MYIFARYNVNEFAMQESTSKLPDSFSKYESLAGVPLPLPREHLQYLMMPHKEVTHSIEALGGEANWALSKGNINFLPFIAMKRMATDFSSSSI